MSDDKKKGDIFDLDNFDKEMVKSCQENLDVYEEWMCDNVHNFISPEGYATKYHDVWYQIEKGLVDKRKLLRLCRNRLAKKQKELRKDGKIPPIRIDHPIPKFKSVIEISSYTDWCFMVDDRGHEEQLEKDLEWARGRFGESVVVSRLGECWTRHQNVLCWKDDAPDMLKQIGADLMFDNGYYPNMRLYTHGADHFLKLTYKGRDGMSNRTLTHNEGQVFDVLEKFYKDIFRYSERLSLYKQLNDNPRTAQYEYDFAWYREQPESGAAEGSVSDQGVCQD